MADLASATDQTSAVRMPQMSDYLNAAPSPANQPGVIMGGLKAGWAQGIGALGSTAAAVGSATNLPTLQSFGEQLADRQAAEAAKVGRPDLEGGVFDQGLSGAPKRVLYQAAKMVPTIGGIAALTAATGGMDVPAGLAGLAARPAAMLGYAGEQAGANLVRGVAAAAPVMGTQ
jgi:hypothetical protein